ncbi:MAG: hypothetical protein MUE34_03315 [Acidimicrobiales bacterium]|nr:hypothetical protein [Acidimicrobiales bacterium]
MPTPPDPAQGPHRHRPVAPAAPRTLADEFAATRGRPVRWEGRLVERVAQLPAVGPSRLVVHRVRARADREPVLHIATAQGRLRVGRRDARTLRLRVAEAPARIEIDLDTVGPTVVRVWNGWIDHGTESAWSGNAGILVDRAGAGALLQCSDGLGPADFTDLVVLVQLTARAQPVVDLRTEPTPRPI